MNIFVGNLEFSATEQDVRQLFERYGVVDTVRIMTDRETGRPRGFGFVEMPDDTAARAAITGLQGAALGGRTLNVNEARPRKNGHDHGASAGNCREEVTAPSATAGVAIAASPHIGPPRSKAAVQCLVTD